MLVLFLKGAVLTSIETKTTERQVYFQAQKWFLISVLHDFLLLIAPLSHPSFHSSLLWSTKPFSFTVLLVPYSLSVKVWLKKRYYSSWAEKQLMQPAAQARSRINPWPLLAPLSHQLAKSSNNPKREFQAICDFPSDPTPTPAPHLERREQSPWIRVICF